MYIYIYFPWFLVRNSQFAAKKVPNVISIILQLANLLSIFTMVQAKKKTAVLRRSEG
jgi:hypothetical protein